MSHATAGARSHDGCLNRYVVINKAREKVWLQVLKKTIKKVEF